MKRLGRELVAWLSLVEDAVALLVVLQLGVDQEHAVLIMAVVSALVGCVNAWRTTQTLLGVSTGLAKAVLALPLTSP